MQRIGEDPFQLGDWLVEPELGRMTRGAEESGLRRQLMQLLVYFAQHQGRVISADELMDAVRGGKIVTGGSVYNSVAELRHALAHGGDPPVEYIETIPEKGYRLVAPVRPLDPADSAGGPRTFFGELKQRSVVRVGAAYLAVAWLLLQISETLVALSVIPDYVGPYVFYSILVGFPVALVLSWSYEMTPAGLKRNSDVESVPGESLRSSRRLDKVIILTLVIAVVLFATDRFLLNPSRAPEKLSEAEQIARDYASRHPIDDKSIAVLPFIGDGSDERQEHFAAGLAEQMTVSLATLDDLRVISMSSILPYRERALSIREIGAVLGVGHVLEGTVRRTTDRIRVVARLTNTRSEVLLWARNFDVALTLDNVLDIQDSIAAETANELQAAIQANRTATSAQNKPANLATLDLYHDGLFYMNTLIRDPAQDDDEERNLDARAEQKFRDAMNADPAWAPPRAGLGRLYHFRWARTGDPEVLAESRRHLLDALRLDDGFGPAYASLAYLSSVDGDFDKALERYRRAISLGSTDAYWGLGVLYRVLGRHSEAIESFQKAVAVDPLIIPLRLQLFESYYCAGRYAEHIENVTEFFPPRPGDIGRQITLANAYAHAGDIETGLRLANGVTELIKNDAPVASVLYLGGETERASVAVATTGETAPFVLLDIIPGAVLMGDEKRALTLLEIAADSARALFDRKTQFDWIVEMRCPPEIQSLAGNPRYEAILRDFRLAN